MSKSRRLLLSFFVGIVFLLAFAEIAESARWRYHAFRRGWIAVYGTRNCRIVTRPLRFQRVSYCNRYSGYLPWYCNDWLVVHYWGPPCYNITRTKYIARPCPRVCWRRRWGLFPVYDWIDNHISLSVSEGGYDRTQLYVPSLGDPDGHLSGHESEIYILVDMSDWIESSQGQSYEPPPDGTDPNTITYAFTDGVSPDLPGYTVAIGSDPFIFNADADPNDYPIELRPGSELYTGQLALLGVQTFNTDGSIDDEGHLVETYNGNLQPADNNWDGYVDLTDFTRVARDWMGDAATAGTPGEIDPPDEFVEPVP